MGLVSNYDLVAGTSLGLDVTIANEAGPITAYDWATPLVAFVWPGGDRTQLFTVAAQWTDPTKGLVALDIASAQTVALDPGRYRGELRVIDPLQGPLLGFEWSLTVRPQPGTAPAPPVYCSYGDMIDFGGRSWLPDLTDDADEAGFAEQRGRARSWLNDLILARAPGGSGSWNIQGLPGYSPFARLFTGGGSTPNLYIRSLLDADCLIRRGWVIEATAKKALSFVCEGQVGPNDSGVQFRQLGTQLANRAKMLAGSAVAEIGYPPAGSNVGGINIVGNPPTVFGEPMPMVSINLAVGSFR